ncbi:MAG: hypothetical protein DWC11_00630 [Candidatus Poseidoniales archaeon]|nr:MAG: hypothetical protein DWC11_00630 [Candidatus Poseidoniales archaeon]
MTQAAPCTVAERLLESVVWSPSPSPKVQVDIALVGASNVTLPSFDVSRMSFAAMVTWSIIPWKW